MKYGKLKVVEEWEKGLPIAGDLHRKVRKREKNDERERYGGERLIHLG